MVTVYGDCVSSQVKIQIQSRLKVLLLYFQCEGQRSDHARKMPGMGAAKSAHFRQVSAHRSSSQQQHCDLGKPFNDDVADPLTLGPQRGRL